MMILAKQQRRWTKIGVHAKHNSLHAYCMCSVVHVDTSIIMHDVLVECCYCYTCTQYLFTAQDNMEESRGTVDGSEASGTETQQGERYVSRTYIYTQATRP